jgi:transcriptional regulator GlxA family with amidase domain
MPTIGILLFDLVEELDFIGPLEVAAASRMLHEQDGVPADQLYDVVTIAATAEPIRCNKGMRVLPHATMASHPPLDVLIVPGGKGTRTAVHDPLIISWLRKMCEPGGARWVTSVCTGVLLLHECGAAAGKRVATHWNHERELQSRGNVHVISDQRYVVDGNLVTSQGVSAGIDMTLWLVGQIHSPEHARRTQRYIQYEPEPPYQDVPVPS